MIHDVTHVSRPIVTNASPLFILLQRAAVNEAPVQNVPSIVHEVLRSPGQPLDAETRTFFEPRFGHDFSQVRVHTDAKAATSAKSVNALAYTVGRDVVFGTGHYQPWTGEGRGLLAHELAHVAQQSQETQSSLSNIDIINRDKLAENEAEEASITITQGGTVRPKQRCPRQLSCRDDLTLPGMDWTIPGHPPPQASQPIKERKLAFITMKRKDISLKGEDKYGHWWTEINGESYGWWPKYPVGSWGTLTGTEGELNGQTSFGGSPTKDPHHGDPSDEEFHPAMNNPTKTDEQVKTETRRFANSYKGGWRWTLGWGQNCRTFQEALMKAVGLYER